MGAAANFAPHAQGAASVSRLVGDLGAVGVKAYYKTYGGNTHIILKGNPRLRKVLTGTKYAANNTKVVTMGLGKSGAIGAAKTGGLFSVAIMSSYRVADYFLNDRTTLNQLIGSLATDITKIAISTGLSIALATTEAVAVFAAGPLIAVVAIGFIATVGLDYLDKKYKITEKLVAALDQAEQNLKNNIEEKKKEALSVTGEALGHVVDYTIEYGKRKIINWISESTKRSVPSFGR
ncbi:hypothetical protein [Kangiella geojedonensis]|uniref:Uncharacterized protein n=1 Tax=Kangiella geojedonensis TaxID=914150 RepID=A0A0F6TRU3_9GAMM|nr:hypothetical protein [Kangiella geojedonensis]AKE52492.1 hypothetical protein TQ33_1546 [Kangiella geojedonensis]